MLHRTGKSSYAGGKTDFGVGGYIGGYGQTAAVNNGKWRGVAGFVSSCKRQSVV